MNQSGKFNASVFVFMDHHLAERYAPVGHFFKQRKMKTVFIEMCIREYNYTTFYNAFSGGNYSQSISSFNKFQTPC